MKKCASILFVIYLLISINITAQKQNIDSVLSFVELKNIHKVDAGVYRGSQPDDKTFKQLENTSIKEILNLRRYNSDNDEAKNTTLKLHHVKMRAEAINEDHLLNALKIIKNRDGDILIHCWHGSDRTGAVVAMYRIIYQNWTKEEAINELKNGEYGYHGIYRNIPKLINKIDIEEFKKKLEE